ncbi:hypothetical protein HC928_19745 [bacterium]|nr:hypothetical protein [bacterium]
MAIAQRQDVYSAVLMPVRVWVERHGDDDDARDVIVEMEDGMMFTAVFVTPGYLNRQMELTLEACKQLPDTAPVRFATLDTPHIVVENLKRDTIEDTIDNLLAMDVFESSFTQVTEHPTQTVTTTNGTGHRATQEVAAVVLSDVLMVDDSQ